MSNRILTLDISRYKFNQGVGSDVAELGSGPGSFDVRGRCGKFL